MKAVRGDADDLVRRVVNLQASADRRETSSVARCGGNVFSHIEYPRQLRLKGEIIQDAFRRIGRPITVESR